MTNAAIDSGPFGDLYVSMGEPVDNGGVDHPRVFEAVHHVGVVRLHHDGAGGFLALSDRRYRTAHERGNAPARRRAARRGAP